MNYSNSQSNLLKLLTYLVLNEWKIQTSYLSKLWHIRNVYFSFKRNPLHPSKPSKCITRRLFKRMQHHDSPILGDEHMSLSISTIHLKIVRERPTVCKSMWKQYDNLQRAIKRESSSDDWMSSKPDQRV